MHKCVADEQVFPLIIERKHRDETSFLCRLTLDVHYLLTENKGRKPKQLLLWPHHMVLFTNKTLQLNGFKITVIASLILKMLKLKQTLFPKQILSFYSFIVLLRVVWLPSPNWDPGSIYQSPWSHSGLYL